MFILQFALAFSCSRIVEVVEKLDKVVFDFGIVAIADAIINKPSFSRWPQRSSVDWYFIAHDSCCKFLIKKIGTWLTEFTAPIQDFPQAANAVEGSQKATTEVRPVEIQQYVLI
jgi:hypothetical protein